MAQLALRATIGSTRGQRAKLVGGNVTGNQGCRTQQQNHTGEDYRVRRFCPEQQGFHALRESDRRRRFYGHSGQSSPNVFIRTSRRTSLSPAPRAIHPHITVMSS